MHPVVAAVLILVASIPALRASAEVTSRRGYLFDEATARHPAWAQRITYEYNPRGVEGQARFERVPVDDARAWIHGDGTLGAIAWGAERSRVEVDARAPLTLRLRTFDHPGWRARVDGEPVPITSENPLRAIEVPVPAGRHWIEVELGPTWDRTLGAWISLAGVAALAILLAARNRLSRRTA
jgi:hypothetical protein